MSMKSIIIWLVAVLLVAVVAGVIASIWLAGSPEEAGDGQRADRRPAVEAAAVTSRTMRQTVQAVGSVHAIRSVTLSPEVSAVLEEVLFREGEHVEAGDLLFTLDDRKLQSRLRSTEAELRAVRARRDNAQTTLERVERLRAQNAASSDELDQVRTEHEALVADVERLQANIELAREEIDDTRIAAPFDGHVAERLVDPGNFVQVDEALARMYQLDPLEVRFHLPERYAGRVTLGMTVRVRVAAYEDERFEGEVIYISPVTEEQTRGFLVKAHLENADGRLRPGAFAEVELVVDERVDRPVVPEQALVATREGYIVFAITHNDVAESVSVSTGLRQNGFVELIDGPEVGRRVVKTGQLRVSDGMTLRVVESDEGERDGQQERSEPDGRRDVGDEAESR